MPHSAGGELVLAGRTGQTASGGGLRRTAVPSGLKPSIASQARRADFPYVVPA